MNFWTGIIIGCFVGANIGVAITAVLVASKRSDSDGDIQLVEHPIDEAVLDDTIPTKVSPYSQGLQYSGRVQFHAESSKALNSD